MESSVLPRLNLSLGDQFGELSSRLTNHILMISPCVSHPKPFQCDITLQADRKHLLERTL